MATSITRCFCNPCGRETDHDVVWRNVRTEESPSEDLFQVELLTLLCRGCKESTILERVRELSGSDEEVTQRYEPPRLWRRAPDWLRSLQDDDPDLKALLDEVYSATNDKQLRLLSMGVRSALDYVMNKILGVDLGTFPAKLDAMVKRGHIGPKQREYLETAIDAGSATTHRGFKPARELLEEMLTVMESVIRDHYITGPMLKTAKTLIPPRP